MGWTMRLGMSKLAAVGALIVVPAVSFAGPANAEPINQPNYVSGGAFTLDSPAGPQDNFAPAAPTGSPQPPTASPARGPRISSRSTNRRLAIASRRTLRRLAMASRFTLRRLATAR